MSDDEIIEDAHVLWFNGQQGFGFITDGNRKDVWFSKMKLRGMKVRSGYLVRFVRESHPEGPRVKRFVEIAGISVPEPELAGALSRSPSAGVLASTNLAQAPTAAASSAMSEARPHIPPPVNKKAPPPVPVRRSSSDEGEWRSGRIKRMGTGHSAYVALDSGGNVAVPTAIMDNSGIHNPTKQMSVKVRIPRGAHGDIVALEIVPG